MTDLDARTMLNKLAAECHRAKWQFDLSEDYKPTARVARKMIANAFDELHRIGDIAMKDRDALRDAQPQSLTGCLHPGNEPKSCQYEGKCLSDACNHRHKTWYGARMTLEARDPNVLYPNCNQGD